MQRYLHKTPRWIQKLYPDFVWSVDTNNKELFLTFDDGPIPEITEFVLKVLREFQAQATFFCVGENLKKYPEIADQITKGRHLIGNHTFNHLKGWETDNEEYFENVMKCEEEITKFQESKMLFRPPYGRIKRSQATALNDFEIVMWNRLSWDFGKNLNQDIALKHLTNASEGSIFVFHDNEKSIKNMSVLLPQFLKKYKEKGFEFKSLKND